MAIYHFSGTVISRSQGRTAVAAAAYRAGEKLYDERQERTLNYSSKQDVVYKEIILPEKAPSWMSDREKLWNAVEKAENRKDSQLAREFNFTLPRELSSAQNIELAREFVKDEFVSRGMVADLCIHSGRTKEGEEQPHAHVMLTMREVNENGFGIKERSWNSKENLQLWRESWSDYVNKYLALNGIDQKIDHRSYAEQGIDLIPQKKIGAEELKAEIRKVRVEEHRLIAKENGEKILDDPSIALNAITHYRSTFTQRDLARFINTHTVDAEQFQVVYEKVKASDQIVALGRDNRDTERFTTMEMVGLEKKMLEGVSALKNQGHVVNSFRDAREIHDIAINKGEEVREVVRTEEGMERAGVGPDIRMQSSVDREIGDDANNSAFSASVSTIAPTITPAIISPISSEDILTSSDLSGPLDLSSQQKDALVHMVSPGDIKCIVGYAGTGKSHLLAQAREAWEGEGYKVHGATLSGIAAESLEGASGIESRTIASRFYYWDTGRGLDKKDILVIDEAGMLGTRQMAKVINEVKNSEAKLVLVGDPQQLQAIEAGAAFRAIIAIISYVELTEIRRQQELWQQNATKSFAMGDIHDAISRYSRYDHVHNFETQAIAKNSLVDMWNDVRISQPNKTQIMLAYTRKDVSELNEIARDIRKRNNELAEDRILPTIRGNQPFAEGDRIYFLRNNRDLGVMNGSLGTIERIKDTKLTIIADKEDSDGNKRKISFDLEYYNHISHGYAATIHKAQSVTVDRSYVLASKYLDSHAVYVGMSRHRESADLFWSKEEFSNEQSLFHSLSRDRSKDIALDYLGFEIESKELDSDTSIVIDAISAQGRAGTVRDEYEKLKQGYLDAKAQTEHIRSYSLGDDFVKQFYIEKEARGSLEDYLNEIVKDVEVLKHLNQSDEKLFSEMNSRLDGKLVKALEEHEVKERFIKEHPEFEDKNLSIEERFYKISEKYNDLKQEYFAAKAQTEHVRSYSLGDDFVRQFYVEKEAKELLEQYTNSMGQDKNYMNHLNKHDEKLFNEVNKKVNELERDFVREMQKDMELSR